VASVLIYVVWNGTLPTLTVLAATVYWGGLNILLLVGFVCRGWHGLGHAAKVARENATFPEHLEAQGSPA
jgi:hypothetical protein